VAQHFKENSYEIAVDQVDFTRHQNFKFEARNPKFETISIGQNLENSKQARFGFRNWDLSLSVCFGFRYSDFGF